MKKKHIILVVIALFVCLGALFAQAAEETAAVPATASASAPAASSFFTIYSQSGIWAHPILLTLVIGLVYAVVRWSQLYRKEKIDAQKFFIKLKTYLKNNQLEEAVKISESYNGTTLGFIFWSAIKIFRDLKQSGMQGTELRNSVENALEEAMLQKVHKLDAGLFWFDTLAQIATYLGLLGTIMGLLDAFSALAGLTGAAQQNALTKGIQLAIGTTALGLMAAIPLITIKGALVTKSNNVISDCDEYSIKLINAINSTIKV